MAMGSKNMDSMQIFYRAGTTEYQDGCLVKAREKDNDESGEHEGHASIKYTTLRRQHWSFCFIADYWTLSS